MATVGFSCLSEASQTANTQLLLKRQSVRVDIISSVYEWAYRFSELSIDRLQLLTVRTRRRKKLDQNIFIRVIHHLIKGLCYHHLRHTGQRLQRGLQRHWYSHKRLWRVCFTHFDSPRVLFRYRFWFDVTFESTCKVIFQEPLQRRTIPPKTNKQTNTHSYLLVLSLWMRSESWEMRVSPPKSLKQTWIR